MRYLLNCLCNTEQELVHFNPITGGGFGRKGTAWICIQSRKVWTSNGIKIGKLTITIFGRYHVSVKFHSMLINSYNTLVLQEPTAHTNLGSETHLMKQLHHQNHQRLEWLTCWSCVCQITPNSTSWPGRDPNSTTGPECSSLYLSENGTYRLNGLFYLNYIQGKLQTFPWTRSMQVTCIEIKCVQIML